MLKYFLSNDQTTLVDGQIDAVMTCMNDIGVQSDDYPTQLGYLERLNDMRVKERRIPVSWDTILMVGGNVLITLLVVAYEQKHVITSKGLTQLIRPRI